jgi:predicted dehydrogenase
MKKLKGVIIGCGAIAREHLSALSAMTNVEVAAVCDISAARAEATAERFGIAKWYVNYIELLKDIRPDLVHITTPPASHFAIAKAGLSAGLNVLCEKPITVTYPEFRSLRQLAEDNQCILMENHNYRFHSSVRRMCNLLDAGHLGEVVDVEVSLALDIYAAGSAYIDQNTPHHGAILRGGIIGDFLTHMAYLAHRFSGPIIDLRTIWFKHNRESSLPTDEFRGFLKGERATARLSFSGNAQPDGFWIRLSGTRAHAEANLFEPPRLTLRHRRAGEPAVAKLVDGISESGAVLKGTVAGFWRKLGGVSNYDGLNELLAQTYQALEKKALPPVSLEEIDQTARLVDQLTAPESKL